jgi:hypothetical protein
VTDESLTALLAQKVMGWNVAPDRSLIGNRSWIPRWRFQPTEKLDDAFRLLEKVQPEQDLIVHHRCLHRQKHRTRLDYYQRTITKAKQA